MIRDRASLTQLLERIELAIEFAGSDEERFRAGRMIQEAVLRELEVIGEAAARVSPASRAIGASIPWKGMVGFKNVAINQYETIDLDVVWKIVQVDLPKIRARVRTLLRDLREK